MATNLTAADFPPGYLDEYIGYQLVDFAIAMIVLQVAVVGLRFASRAYSKLYFGVEDVLVSIALVCALVMDATSICEYCLLGSDGHSRAFLYWLYKLQD